MKLKAILIDDEINIIRNLQQVLPWNEQQVEVVGTAKNGVQALELVQAHHPQLIFCDIRMPVMDGIDFLRELRVIDQEAEVIMLTGYQDFEYARAVLRFGVMDYVLKPIDYDAFEQLFVKAVQKTRSKLQQSQLAYEAKHRMKDIEFEKVVLEYIRGFYEQGQHETNRVVDIQNREFSLFVLEIGQQPQAQGWLNSWSDEVLQSVKEQYGDIQACLLHVTDRYWAIVLAGDLRQIDDIQLELTMKRFRSLLSEHNEQLTIAAYERMISIEEMHIVWNTICKELSFTEQPYLIVREEGNVRLSNEQQVWQYTDHCIAAIKRLEREAARNSLLQLNQLLGARSLQTLQQLEMLINSVIVYMLRELRRYDAISMTVEKEVWQQLNTTSKLKELMLLLSKLVEEAFSEHSNKRPQVSIHVAKDYIESHLSEDIAAEEVAQYLNISVSYFSTIFKQQYGMTFIEFVTIARIERAKSLLTITKKSITEVAKSVGYTDRRYFNKVFQKRVGMLPSEYRKKTGSEG